MTAPWKSLRVGDRVRIVRIPGGADGPGCVYPAETRALHQRLIASARSVPVDNIDEYGTPWISCSFKHEDGKWHHHLLAMNDDSWERAESSGRSEGQDDQQH